MVADLAKLDQVIREAFLLHTNRARVLQIVVPRKEIDP